MIVAVSRLLALRAAGSVMVSYTKGKKPVISAKDVMRTLNDRTKLPQQTEKKQNRNKFR
jgi:hypothetical protein